MSRAAASSSSAAEESTSSSSTAAVSSASTEAVKSTSAAASTGKADGTYALVPKSAGNPFNEREADGFTQAVEAMGGTAVVNYPDQATADAQITVIQSLISQGVDSIAVAENMCDHYHHHRYHEKLYI